MFILNTGLEFMLVPTVAITLDLMRSWLHHSNPCLPNLCAPYFAKVIVVDKQRVLNASTTTIAPMDIDVFNFNCKLDEMEEDEWDEEQDLTMAIILLGVIEAHRLRVGCARNDANPAVSIFVGLSCFEIPVLYYRSQNNRAYITTMAFDVATFHVILEGGFSVTWDTRDDAPWMCHCQRDDGGLLGDGREG
ncbi:hypothetical protein C8R45DRAFT_918262 [Mycena sanguinolenta]|nr:hypothetical protein C8R45DRAFT_918262 [Mycena sanguinolenta]